MHFKKAKRELCTPSAPRNGQSFVPTDWILCGTAISCGNNEILLGWGQRHWLQHPLDTSQEPAFYFPDFFLETPTPWFTHEHTQVISADGLFSSLTALDRQNPPTPPVWQPANHPLFEKVFTELQCYIADNQLVKGVPFVRETAAKSMNADRLIYSMQSALRYLLKNPAFLYGYWDEEHGILGVSPEVLFQSEKKDYINTMACAGTRPVDCEDEELLSDPKELEEHRIVVEGIHASLAIYGEVFVGERKLLKLPQLKHLVTPIASRTKKALPFEEIVKALHPTPALGAFPRNEGTRWLKNYQKILPRHHFGAPAGFSFPNREQSACYVAIRNVEWDLQNMYLHAGCGIVAGSQLEREWAEVNLKLQAIKDTLSL